MARGSTHPLERAASHSSRCAARRSSRSATPLVPAPKGSRAIRSRKTSWGHPDLQGVWDQTTGTPLERPDEYKGRKLLTDVEAAERERMRFAEFDENGRAGGTGDYGSVWREQSKNALNRTALITSPGGRQDSSADARGTEDLEASTRARRARGEADSWHDRSLWERCITRGTPRIPNNYNSNWHILQTEHHVVILQEMIHETRIIPLDGRPHVAGTCANGSAIRVAAGKTTRSSSRPPTSANKAEFRGFPEQRAAHRTVPPSWPGPDGLRVHHRRPDHLHQAVDRVVAVHPGHPVFRVRLSRRQLRPAEHPGRRPRCGKIATLSSRARQDLNRRAPSRSPVSVPKVACS